MTIKIDNKNNALFEKMWEVYEYSFPPHEKRTKQNQTEALELGANISVFLEDDKFVGFLIYWEEESFIYIEHFALCKEMRNMGYGSKMLTAFIEENKNKVTVLDIDPPIDEISNRRKFFYERLGFIQNSHKHIHPPYNNPLGEKFELALMSYGRELTREEFNIFKEKLYNTIVTY